MVIHPITISPYERRYRYDVRDLLFRNYRAHSHLDWHDTDQWLDSTTAPMRLAWANGRLVGVLALSEPLSGTCWVRLAAVHDNADPAGVLAQLWKPLVEELRALDVETVALLVLRDWVVNYIGALGFRFIEDIITLRRTNRRLPPFEPSTFKVRLGLASDLRIITAIDQAAFPPPWQLTFDEVRQAQRTAAFCTVAVDPAQEVVGYQISTLYFDGAHLARLAVDPARQSQGVGRLLVDDLLRRLHRRGVANTTVNTQASNHRSQRLYVRFGFIRNGYDLPVWMATI